MPADLDVGYPFDRLRGEPAVAEELPGFDGFHDPQPEASVGIELEVPVDPGSGLVPRLRLWIETHGFLVSEHRGELVEIVMAVLPKS